MMKITWEEVDECCNDLAEKIKESSFEFDSIYALPRGGLVPGVILSHKLKLLMVSSPKERSLIVDEISDSGKTLQVYPWHKKATLFIRRGTKVVPEFYSREIVGEDWLIFPWE